MTHGDGRASSLEPPGDRPARNRVAPTGEILAAAGRGAWTGNRGRLHEGRGTRDVVRNHQGKAWITCVLVFKERRLPQWEPRHYTPLFFLDEAVALAAGHRPCAECRRAAFNAFRDAWPAEHPDTPYAATIDARLHLERVGRDTHRANWTDLPDGTFVRHEDGPAVVVDDHLVVYGAEHNRYGDRRPRPTVGAAAVITPPSTLEVLRAGYPVQIDRAAHATGP